MKHLLLTASLLVLSGTAQADFLTDFKACAAMNNGAERLACYDALAQKRASEEAAGRGATVPPTAVETEQAREQRFGAERLKQKPQEIAHEYAPDSISTRIRGEISGWGYKTRFELENGQVWQVMDKAEISFHASNPAVTIEKGVFGVYYMSIDGINSKPKVKRVK